MGEEIKKGSWGYGDEGNPFCYLLGNEEGIEWLEDQGYTVLYHEGVGMWGVFERTSNFSLTPVKVLPDLPEEIGS